MLKKIYVSPETKTANVVKANLLLQLSPIVFVRGTQYIPETTCPFNNEWCADKQNILDEWKNAVKLYAKQGENYMFHTCGSMFDGCPLNYTSLCKAQKQRG